jgi:hypothetical protein
MVYWPMAGDWLDQLILCHCTDVLRPSHAVFAKARFAGAQEQVPGAQLLN